MDTKKILDFADVTDEMIEDACASISAEEKFNTLVSVLENAKHDSSAALTDLNTFDESVLKDQFELVVRR